MTTYELFPGVTVTVDETLFTIESGFAIEKPLIDLPDYKLSLNMVIANMVEDTKSEFESVLVLRVK